MTFHLRPPGILLHPVRLILAAAAAMFLLAFAAAPAGAVVLTAQGIKYGVNPHATRANVFIPGVEPLHYQGGPIVHASSVYAVYWDPAVLRQGDPGAPGKYHGDWQTLINGFLKNVANDSASGSSNSVFALTPQYTESNGTTAAYSTAFRGGFVDHTTYPADGCTDPRQAMNRNFACLTDAQLRAELTSFVTSHNIQVSAQTIFYIMTPPGVTVCIEANRCSTSSDAFPFQPVKASEAEKESYERSFCSYHGTTVISGTGTLYAAIPWVTGTLGSILEPQKRDGSDCQNGTGVMQEPEQSGLGPDGTFDHALPDVLITQIASEQVATITNPQLNAWYEPITGYEVSDQCRNWFEAPPVVQGTGTPQEGTEAGKFSNQNIGGTPYYLNTVYNQAALYNEYPSLPCELHSNLVASFTEPTSASAGTTLTFDGNESVVTLEQSANPAPSGRPLHRAIFSWNFGDGTSATGPGYSEEKPAAPLFASIQHAYQYGGTYEVTLTVTDVSGHTASVGHLLSIAGPAAPAPPNPTPPAGPSGTPGGPGAPSAPGPAGGPGGGGAVPALPTPVIGDSVVSRGLRGASHGGLIVRYTVDQQVAGHFEVLLDKSIARRLGLSGPLALGLPASLGAKIVIARALLVTTSAGHSTISILFSKRTAKRLAKLHRVPLMLRLSVRNASHTPTSATLLSAFTLTN